MYTSGYNSNIHLNICSATHDQILSNAVGTLKRHGSHCINILGQIRISHEGLDIPLISSSTPNCGSTIVWIRDEPNKDTVDKLDPNNKYVFVVCNAQKVARMPWMRNLFNVILMEDLDWCKLESPPSKIIFSTYKRTDVYESTIERTELYTDSGIKMGSPHAKDIKSEMGLQGDFGWHDFHAVAFHFPPYSTPDYEDQSKSGGFEYLIAKLLTESLKLKMVLHPPSTGQRWGREEPEGSGNYSGKMMPFLSSN